MDRFTLQTDIIKKILQQENIDPTIFTDFNLPLTAFAELIAICHYEKNYKSGIASFVNRYEFTKIDRNVLEKGAEIVIDSYSRSEIANNKVQLKEFAQIYTDSFELSYKKPKHYYENFPTVKTSGCGLVDLASGPQFIELIEYFELDKNAFYYPIDISNFVRECILYKSNQKGLINIFPITADIRTITRDDIPVNEIDVIRAKNIFPYITEEVENNVLKFLTFLDEGGRFIFQDLSHLEQFENLFSIKEFRDLIYKVLLNGFSVTYTKGNPENKLSYDSLIFVKDANTSLDVNSNYLKNLFLFP